MRRLALLLVSVGLAASAGAQVIGVQPEPMGLYWWDSTQAQFDKQVNAYAAYPQQNTPRPIAFYGWNSALGMWTPCDIVTQSCPWAGGIGTVTSVGLALPPSTFAVSGSPVTTAGILTGTFVNQANSTFFANFSGSGGVPSWWTLAAGTGVTLSVTGSTVSINASGTLDIENNGTPVPDQATLNFLNAAPSLPTGYQPVTWGNDSGGGLGGWVPPTSSGFTMQTIPPTTGQYVALYPTTCGYTQSGTGFGVCANPPTYDPISGENVQKGGGIGCAPSGSLNPCGATISFAWTLPSYVIQANITSVYIVTSTFSGGTHDYDVNGLGCLGSPVDPQQGSSINSWSSQGWTYHFSSVPTVNTLTCTASANASLNTGPYGSSGWSPVLYVYYTGTAPPAGSALIYVAPPLQFADNTLSLILPDNGAFDYTGTNTYNAIVPAFSNPLSPSTAQGPTINSTVVLTVAHGSTSTAPTLNINGSGNRTIVIMKNGSPVALTSGDIVAGVPASLIFDGVYYDLQNPQVSGGTLTSALTGAASGGAAPGSTYNGGAAVTFDYHTFGAPGLAASNTFTGATTNDYSGTSQFKLPVAAGYAAAAQGEAGYDSTDKNWNLWANGANNIAATFPAASPPADTDCAQWSVSGGHYVLGFTSGSCGTGSGGDTITSPNGTLAVGGTSTNTTLDVKPVSAVADTSTPVTVSTAFPAEFHFNQNATAATAITYNLPTAAAGKQFCFKNSNNGSAANTGTLKIQTSAAGQYIIDATGTLSASDGYVISGGAASDGACVVGVDSTHWQLYVGVGTWTTH